jgi:hypothetical protein
LRRVAGATGRNDPAGRLRLLEPNVKVFEDIVPRIVEAAPQAGQRGALAKMSDDETRALGHSAKILRNAVAKYVNPNGVADTVA